MGPEEKEVELLDRAYQAALIKLGQQIIKALLGEWLAVTVTNPASLGAFTVEATAVILRCRRQAQELSLAHTRLVRGLLLGSTIPTVDSGPASLGSLRDDFYTHLDTVGVGRPRKAKAFPDETPVSVDPIPGLDERFADRKKDLERELDSTFRILLDRKVERDLKALKKDDVKYEKKLKGVELDVGVRIVSAAERLALNGARDADVDVIQLDPKGVSYIRQHDPSKPDHPCGFCSMLMTRGFLSGGIYRSEKKATLTSGGDKYHTGCHCIAVKVYRLSQLDSPRFDEHRKLAEDYRRVTEGLSGDEALKAWDKHIRSTRKVSEKLGKGRGQVRASLEDAA